MSVRRPRNRLTARGRSQTRPARQPGSPELEDAFVAGPDRLQITAHAGLVGDDVCATGLGPDHLVTQGKNIGDQLQEVRLIIGQPASITACALPVDDKAVVVALVGIDAGPDAIQSSSRVRRTDSLQTTSPALSDSAIYSQLSMGGPVVGGPGRPSAFGHERRHLARRWSSSSCAAGPTTGRVPTSGPASGFDPCEASRHPAHQALERLLPAGRVYAVTCGHRMIVCLHTR